MDLYWQQRRAFFQPRFISWVDRLLRREPIADMRAYREFLRADSPASGGAGSNFRNLRAFRPSFHRTIAGGT
jgi:hypothetical protein